MAIFFPSHPSGCHSFFISSLLTGQQCKSFECFGLWSHRHLALVPLWISGNFTFNTQREQSLCIPRLGQTTEHNKQRNKAGFHRTLVLQIQLNILAFPLSPRRPRAALSLHFPAQYLMVQGCLGYDTRKRKLLSTTNKV